MGSVPPTPRTFPAPARRPHAPGRAGSAGFGCSRRATQARPAAALALHLRPDLGGRRTGGRGRVPPAVQACGLSLLLALPSVHLSAPGLSSGVHCRLRFQLLPGTGRRAGDLGRAPSRAGPLPLPRAPPAPLPRATPPPPRAAARPASRQVPPAPARRARKAPAAPPTPEGRAPASSDWGSPAPPPRARVCRPERAEHGFSGAAGDKGR